MEEDKKKNILGQVAAVMDSAEFKQGAKVVMETLPSVAQMHRQLYDEMIKQGYSSSEAFKFTSQYFIAMLTPAKP